MARSCLIHATLGSTATNVPPEALEVLLLVADAQQVAQARGNAALIQDGKKQADAFRRIGQALSQRGEPDSAGVILRRALAAAEAIGYEQWRAQALSGLAHSWARIDQPDNALTTFSAAFRAARLAARRSVFEVLETAVPTLAGLEAGRILVQVFHATQEVETWWGAP